MKVFLSDLVAVITARKFYVALAGFALALVQLYVTPLPTWYGPLVAFLTAVGVYAVPNDTSAR